eukprot:m.84284 g.84284  ORF g.84284 m.84284 type:complete len:198 (+) comp21182_c0_seq1:739-1332(+)
MYSIRYRVEEPSLSFSWFWFFSPPRSCGEELIRRDLNERQHPVLRLRSSAEREREQAGSDLHQWVISDAEGWRFAQTFTNLAENKPQVLTSRVKQMLAHSKLPPRLLQHIVFLATPNESLAQPTSPHLSLRQLQVILKLITTIQSGIPAPPTLPPPLRRHLAHHSSRFDPETSNTQQNEPEEDEDTTDDETAALLSA